MFEREAWYEEADEDDAPPDIERWEAQLRDIIRESRSIPVPEQVHLEDDLIALQRAAEELWGKLHVVLEVYPRKIRELEEELARISAGRLIVYSSDHSVLPGATKEWEEGDLTEEEWESDLQGDEDSEE